jgi:hypothetical protein
VAKIEVISMSIVVIDEYGVEYRADRTTRVKALPKFTTDYLSEKCMWAIRQQMDSDERMWEEAKESNG